VHQIIEDEVRDAEAVLDRLDPQRRPQATLPDAGRP
jgi:hypothetical protein